MQINSDKLKTEEKKLKKYPSEHERLDRIINHIKQCQSVKELKYSPISNMYHFEELKHEMSGYCSFNLCKSRSGVIRFIFTIDEENQIVNVVFISLKHYDDFKRTL